MHKFFHLISPFQTPKKTPLQQSKQPNKPSPSEKNKKKNLQPHDGRVPAQFAQKVAHTRHEFRARPRDTRACARLALKRAFGSIAAGFVTEQCHYRWRQRRSIIIISYLAALARGGRRAFLRRRGLRERRGRRQPPRGSCNRRDPVRERLASFTLGCGFLFAALLKTLPGLLGRRIMMNVGFVGVIYGSYKLRGNRTFWY